MFTPLRKKEEGLVILENELINIMEPWSFPSALRGTGFKYDSGFRCNILNLPF
jgi:hypothetical protein